jgi:hypothetical protein
MQIRTRTAVIPAEAIQAAYNNAVMLERMALAREIGQLWLNVLVEQKVQRVQTRVKGRSKKENVRTNATAGEIEPRLVASVETRSRYL